MKRNLTDRTLAALKPDRPGHRYEVVDTRQPGLRVRIAGTPVAPIRTWSAMGRLDNRKVRKTIGRWPIVSLADARHEAEMFLWQLHKGVNTVAQARIEKARAAAAPKADPITTLGNLVDHYQDLRQSGRTAGRRSGRPMTPENLKKWRRHLDVAFGHMYDRPLADLKPYDIESAITDRVARTAGGGRNSYANFRPIVKFALKHRLIDDDISELADPEIIVPAGQRDVVVTDKQLEKILPVLVDPVLKPYGPAFHFAILTAARRGEVEYLDWADLDLKRALWHKPTTKNDTGQMVPLSHQAVGLLVDLDPQERGVVFATSNGRRFTNWGRALGRVHDLSTVKGWHIHDLRRTAATIMARLGALPVVIEHILGHAQPHGSAIAKVYQRYSYENEMRRALQLLADHLGEAQAGRGDVIVPLQPSEMS